MFRCGAHRGTVVANEPICDEHYLLVLRVIGFGRAVPGQFIQVRCGEAGAPGMFLRRPFSIAGARYSDDATEIDILYRVLGGGTQWLAKRQRRDPIDVIGPLGRGFDVVEDSALGIVVGGGVGLPPVMWLARVMAERGIRVMAVAGARSIRSLPVKVVGSPPQGGMYWSASEFGQARVLVATDDGSCGIGGTVLEGLKRLVESLERRRDRVTVYACGPEGMLRAVAEYAIAEGMACQVCMERMMACGMGTCQSCVVRIRDTSSRSGWRYRLCCADGPVFDAREVVW